MIRFSHYRVVCALIALGCGARGAELELASYKSPTYPTLARLARIAGTVVLEFEVNAERAASAVVLVSGHPLLAPSAKENLLTWRFVPGTEPDAPGRQRVTYVFEFSTEFADGYYDPKQERVQFEGTQLVRVRTSPSGTLLAKECPDTAVNAAPGVVSAADSVTLSRSGCYGTCPSYEVTLYADGRVEWQGHSFVAAAGERKYQVPEAEARRLIESFQSAEVQGLCGDYSRGVTDSASALVEMNIGGHRKSIHDYAASSPPWFQRLRNEIDRVGTTHDLRHGEAGTEPLVHIQEEYLPKPGLTDLMIAASRSDVTELRKLIAMGAQVDEMDSSGWTALMYASAAHAGSSAVDALLQAGASAKHVSPYGDTVLMAASLTGDFDQDLARLGANIDAQNRDGVSALMLLADRNRPDEIKAALKAGANAKLVDRSGHSAEGYLDATNCLRSLVRGFQPFMVITGPCPAGDRGEFRKSRKMLRSAANRHR